LVSACRSSLEPVPHPWAFFAPHAVQDVGIFALLISVSF
jgi:hypothetical protein